MSAQSNCAKRSHRNHDHVPRQTNPFKANANPHSRLRKEEISRSRARADYETNPLTTVTRRPPLVISLPMRFLLGLSPFGPIFGKELRVAARRRRNYLLRVAYLGGLLLFLLLAWTQTNN